MHLFNKVNLIWSAAFYPVADIYVFGIGMEIYDEDLQPLTVGSGGSHYFRMRDIRYLQETFDAIIGKFISIYVSNHLHNLIWHNGDIWYDHK